MAHGGRGGGHGGGGGGGKGKGKGAGGAQNFAQALRAGITGYLSHTLAHEVTPKVISAVEDMLSTRIREPIPGADPFATDRFIQPILSSVIAGLTAQDILGSVTATDPSLSPTQKERISEVSQEYLDLLADAQREGYTGVEAITRANDLAKLRRERKDFKGLMTQSLTHEQQDVLRRFMALLSHDATKDAEFKRLRRFISEPSEMRSLFLELVESGENHKASPPPAMPGGSVRAPMDFLEAYPLLVGGVADANRAFYAEVVLKPADEVMMMLRGLAPERTQKPGQAALNFVERGVKKMGDTAQAVMQNPEPVIQAAAQAAGQIASGLTSAQGLLENELGGDYVFTHARVERDRDALSRMTFFDRVRWVLKRPTGHPISMWEALKSLD